MSDPTLWGDASAQVVWAYYLANLVYFTGTVAVILAAIGIVILFIVLAIVYFCKEADKAAALKESKKL